jgi:hypothetical protein
MDKAGKKSVLPSVVIAAVIAVVAAFLHDPDVWVAVWLALLFFALVYALFFIPVGMVMDQVGGKSLRASLLVAAAIAAVLYIADAFVFFSENFDYVLFGVALLYFLPATLWALRRDRRVAGLRSAKAGIYLIAVIAILLTIDLQNRMADRRAVKLGDACLAYLAKYHHYPRELNALVPEFISSVPVARYGLPSDRFVYDGGLTLSYGTFERREYHVESHRTNIVWSARYFNPQ